MTRLLVPALAVLLAAAPALAQQPAEITPPRLKPPTVLRPHALSSTGDVLQGEAVVSLCVDAHGKVTRVEIAASSGDAEVDAAAAADARLGVYEPARQDGRPMGYCGLKQKMMFGVLAPDAEEHSSAVNPLRLALLAALGPGTALAVMTAAGAAGEP